MIYLSIHLASILGSLALIALAIRKNCIGTGKYITEPMLLWWYFNKGKRKLKKLAKEDPHRSHQLNIRVFPAVFRLKQQGVLFVALLLTIPLPFLKGNAMLIVQDSVYFWPVFLLFADDLISTIDKDKWKKRFRALKNKLTWKWLPAPVPTT